MAVRQQAKPVTDDELQTLLWISWAISHEQDEERICASVCEAATSLLGTFFTALVLKPTQENHQQVVRGKLGGAPLSRPLTRWLAELAHIHRATARAIEGVVTLRKDEIPPGLSRRKISHLNLVNLVTSHRELGIIIVGWKDQRELEARDRLALRMLADKASLALENIQLHKAAEHQSQALQALFEAAPLPIIAHDADANVTMWNPAAARTFGWDQEEVIGRPYPIVPDEKQGEFLANLERASRGDPLSGLETLRQRKDGSLIDVRLWTVPMSGGGAMVVVDDLTEDRRSEEALLQTEERFRRIFDHSNDAIFLIDVEGDAIIDVNPKACNLLGFSREELLAMNISAIHPNEMPQLRAFAQSVFDQGRGWTNQLTCRTKIGDFLPSEVSASVFEISGHTLLVAMLRDTTERQQAEEIQRELAVLEERNRLAREIHDTLAQGLTAILWQLNAAERAMAEGGAPALEYLDRLRELARQGLQEARRSVWDLRLGPLEGLTLAEALRRESERVIGSSGIQVSFAVSGPERVLPSGAEAAILRICQEALANVLKHADATRVEVTLAFDASQVQLAVQDNGIGFDPEITTTRSKDSGGFGLINMRERVRLLGGELTVQSQPGRGTLVEARLALT